MKDIGFAPNCPLTRYLEEISMSAEPGLNTQFASILLFGLGYPSYTQPPDCRFIADLLWNIREDNPNNLLSESTAKCVLCPRSDNCEVGVLFKSS
jgi:hypothetical protein